MFSPTLFRYIAKRYLAVFALTLTVAVAIAFMADMVETARKLADSGAGVGQIAALAFMRMPSLMMQMLPYAALASGAIAYRKLADGSELTAMRAAGASARQFLLPAAAAAALAGLFATTLFQPLAAAMHAAHARKERLLKQEADNTAGVVETGLWLKQEEDGASAKTFIRAKRVSGGEAELRDVMFFTVDESYLFLRRVDAPTAELTEDGWFVEHPRVTVQAGRDQTAPQAMHIPSMLSPRAVRESFSPPESIPFWDMPGFIRILGDSGFSVIAHLLEFYRIASLPFALGVMAFFGAVFTLTHARFAKGGLSIAAALGCGLIFFSLERFAQALGLSGKLPMPFAVTLAPALALCAALYLLLHREEAG